VKEINQGGYSELLKVPSDKGAFGGWQNRTIVYREVVKRFCAAKGCSQRGAVQMPTGPAFEGVEGYRILCPEHTVLFTLLMNAFIGDPSAVEEARSLAEILCVDFVSLMRDEPVDIGTPEQWQCARCGGKMIPEEYNGPYGMAYTHHCTDRPEGIGG
jgi:hypothetical protein